jgi:alpha-mannosidase
VVGNYELSLKLAGEEIEGGMRELTSLIDTRGEGIPIVVFNPLSWSRTDPVEVELNLEGETLAGLGIVGPDGKSIPLQLLSPGKNSVKISFIASDVPPFGYSLYRLVRGDSAGITSLQSTLKEAVIENRFYRIEIDPATGAVHRLFVKDGEWDALDEPGNVVAVEEDNGDFWELYGPLDGGSRIAMKDIHPPPRPGEAVFSTDLAGAPGRVTRGPVFSEFSVSHQLGEDGRLDTRIRLYHDLRRIEFHTGILNNESFVRYRLLFPTSIGAGRCVHEIPFGAIERPCGIEFPAQNWIDYGDREHGLALINRGLPGNNVADGDMMLSLMRSTRIVAYGFGGGYEPGMGSDSGFELGRELEFDYALFPHDGDWREHGIHREGMEFNNPLIARQTTPHAGSLPAEWSSMRIDHPNVVVSALKHCERGGIILRIYEATGMPAEGVEIETCSRVTSVEEVDLMEDGIGGPTSVDGRIRLDLGPFEIKTLRLELGLEPGE